MSYITKFAEGFMHLFQTGAETFISWMTGIVPVVLMLMVAMNFNCFSRRRKSNQSSQTFCQKSCYAVFSAAFLSAFMLGNPMSLRWLDFTRIL